MREYPRARGIRVILDTTRGVENAYFIQQRELGQRDEAIDQLRAALAAPLDPDWEPEDRRFKEQAEALLRKLAK